MFGFFCDVFNDNQVSLMVQYFNEANMSNSDIAAIQNNPSYYIGDSITDALNYFNLYVRGNNVYKHTPEEEALNLVGISNEEANDFREKVNNLINNFDDLTALDNMILYPKWEIGKNYQVNDKVRYNNKLYKVLQQHTSQATWGPDVAVSLYAKILASDSTIEEWEQPDSTNGYAVGDRVRYNGHIYESLINNNVWSPDGYAQGWQLIE